MTRGKDLGVKLRLAGHFLLGAIAGIVGGLVTGAVVGGWTADRASAVEYDPFRLNGGTYSSGCWDWKNDSASWKDATGDGNAEPFSYWWSGQSRFWNNSSAHVCWHNDENTTSGDPSRPGADITAGSSTAINFKTDHWNSFTAWPGVVFQNTGCLGVEAVVYAQVVCTSRL
jgi:hypothetical protein